MRYYLLLLPCDCDHRTLVVTGSEFNWEENSYLVTTSIGGAVISRDGPGSELILKAADTACYEAKHQGGDSVIFHKAV